MEDEFKPKDIVRVKSGGPKMTVTYVGQSPMHEYAVFCTWFDGPKKYEDTFHPAALEKC